MQKTRVILTVDTEPDVAGAMADRDGSPPLFDEPVWGEVNGRSEGLGFITRTLSEFDLAATFFVETVHTRHFGPEPMGRVATHLLDAGQDVQLHIHPVWRNFSKPPPAGGSVNDDSASMDRCELADLIAEGSAQIERWTGSKPVALRTGNFDAALSVYEAMARCGLALSSNVCIASHDYADAQLRVAGGAHLIADTVEIAVSCFRDPGPVGRGRYRAAQITACSASELMLLLRTASRQRAETVVLVTHPFEFIKRGDSRYRAMRANLMVQRRLTTLCRFLDAHRDTFDVCTFADLALQQPLTQMPAPALRSTTARSLARAAQNFINDRL